uniref:Protein farnesyltransferase/geranylgeranyltransferase type-1 subunit alpha n=1 Tax=Chlamydomonas leiostraca TaxID=1034604 RepID=A0A7S0R5Z1_9CHLO|mmetsp:Transcript_14750/g.36797  ORF Transcript_14750/g.36797 Transcript_14750/m.36797 type:complete len:373 (+) Transcript_14750:319-1437(+)
MSSEEYVEEVPYAQRPEWSDMQPLELSEGVPVVSIQYFANHKEQLAYFRAVMAKGEKSERALALTADMIHRNQADYTAWEYRWQCLNELGKDMSCEYEFTDPIMADNAKNYQLWNHRRKCMLAQGSSAAQRELQVAEDALRVDEKNYHAWAHRQAAVQAYGGALWELELAFSGTMISKDVRNNSAWNQRAFAVQHQLREVAALGDAAASQRALTELIDRELQYISAKIELAPRNESVWNYLRGLFLLPGMPAHAMGLYEQVYVLCKEALLDAPSCPPALDVMSEYYLHLACVHAQHLAHLQHASPPSPADIDKAKASVQQAAQSATTLLNHLLISDPIRTMYWNHRQRDLDTLVASLGLGPDAQPAAAAAMA